MKRRWLIFVLLLTLFTNVVKADADYKSDAEYLALRDSMHHAFNDADSARFFVALKNLEDYLLAKAIQYQYLRSSSK